MFRRKQSPTRPGDADETSATDPDPGSTAPTAPAAGAVPAGPRDIDDVDLQDGVQRIDLGGMLLAPNPGRELRIQLNEQTKEVQAVLIAGPEGAVELKPFAAPRNGDLWGEIRGQIAEDMTRRGGTVSEREGRHGIELVGSVPVQVSPEQVAQQPSRIVGVNGPRWLLRATFLGSPAVNPDTSDWDEVLSSVVVRRGTQAMPVGDPLPLVLPPQARPQD